MTFADAEIERRGLVETTGRTPVATLYTEMMRKSANWREDNDNRPPLFYRNDRGAFGRWADLAPGKATQWMAFGRKSGAHDAPDLRTTITAIGAFAEDLSPWSWRHSSARRRARS